MRSLAIVLPKLNIINKTTIKYYSHEKDFNFYNYFNSSYYA